MRKFYFFFFLLSAFAYPNLFATDIKGIIKDQQTGEPLIEATVQIEGTQYGAITELDGSYIISNVPAGTYKIICRYIGYTKFEQEITITAGETVHTLDIVLKEESQHKAVVIVGERDKESDETARKTEQNADNVINVMSAKTIQLLPDINVGNVLQRVSGVSVTRNSSGDGHYAIIRGMDKRYNYTLVNGVKIPSPDMKNRYIAMDIFPAELLERLEVTKSLTPSMEGDAIGGAMNLVMKSAPSKLTYGATTSGGFGSLLFNQAFSGYSTNGMQWQDPAAEHHSSSYVAKPSDISLSVLDYKNKTFPLNNMGSFTIGDRVFNKRLGIMVAGSYQRLFRQSNQTFFHLNETLYQPTNAPTFDYVQNRQYSNLQTRIGGHVKLDYTIPKFLIFKDVKLNLYNMFVQLDETQHRYAYEIDLPAAPGEYNIKNRSKFTQQQIYNTTLQAEANILKNLRVNGSAVYSIGAENVPAWLDSEVDYGTHTGGGSTVQPLTAIWYKAVNKDLTGYGNVLYDLTKDIELSGGGMRRHSTRNAYYNDYTLETLLPGPGSTVVTQPYPGNQNQVIYNFQPATAGMGSANNPNNYSASEDITAGYAQAKIMFFKRLQAIGGLREEITNQSYTSQLDPSLEGKYASYQYVDPLPSLNTKYIINEKQNLRLSYYKAINRAQLYELVPVLYKGDQYDEVGNFNLKHARANNFDLRYELFPKPNEQLLLGVFYKKIFNPIEWGFSPEGLNSFALMPQNYGNATNYGFEMTFVKYFLKNWGLSGNYTYTNSNITTTKEVKSRFTNSSGQSYDSIYYANQKRPLQGQSANVFNTSLIYKNAKLGLDAQLAGVYTGRKITTVSGFYGLDYWQRGLFQLDFSAEKRIFKNFSLYTKITNLTNAPIIIEMVQPYNSSVEALPDQTRSDRILVEKQVFKQTFLFGLRYKFK